MPDDEPLSGEQRKLLQDSLTWRGLNKRTRIYEYAQTELKLTERFNKAKTAVYSPSKIELEGFVSRLAGKRRFILRPTPTATRGVLCDPGEIRNLPLDYELIRLAGYRTLENQKSNLANTDIILVDNIEPIHVPGDYLKPDISLHDATEILLEGIVDAQTEIGRNIALSLTSSLRDDFRLGGLTSTLMPLDDSMASQTQEFLQNLHRTVPADLTAEGKVRVQIARAGSFEIRPFSWHILETTPTQTRLHNEDAMLRRSTALSWNELTIGVSGTTLAPKSLEEIWIKRSDLPVMVEVPPLSTRLKGYSLELAKYLITTHTNFPYITFNLESDFKHVNQRLKKLRREYDHDGYGGLIDFDVRTGSPRTVLHIAEALARASGNESVNQTLLDEATSLFIDSRKRVFELWEDRDVQYGTVPIREKMKHIEKTKRQVYKHIADHPPDISLPELMDAFPRKQRSVIEECLAALVQLAAIYQTSVEDNRYAAYE